MIFDNITIEGNYVSVNGYEIYQTVREDWRAFDEESNIRFQTLEEAVSHYSQQRNKNES